MVAAQRALVAGLVLSSAYLAFSLVAKSAVDRAADDALARMGLADAPRFSVPMPFNTLLWRVVAMTPDGFVEGERSIVADSGPMTFRRHASDVGALHEVRDWRIVRQLAWFNHGYMKAEVRDGTLVLSDLRMGSEPDYTFRFAVARRDGRGWREMEPQAVEWPWDVEGRLSWMWHRIWVEPSMSPRALPAGAGAAHGVSEA
jgi:inner membrane protein